MNIYGLIGYPLGHSFSRKFFTDKFTAEGIGDCSYQNFPLESIEKLPDMQAQNPGLKGFNVTIPYKQAVIPYLRFISEEAQEIGAVNCVKITPDGLAGYNTDAYGFSRSLLTLIGSERPEALVLGTGGASKAVKYVLARLGIEYISVSRTEGKDRVSYAQLTPEITAGHKLIINATPLGTFPNVDRYPEIPYDAIGNGHYLFDLVYNPPLTEFLKRGQHNGAAICNGYDMLVGQAEISWEIWTGKATE